SSRRSGSSCSKSAACHRSDAPPRATGRPVLSQRWPSWCRPRIPAPRSPLPGTVQLVSSTAATTPMGWFAGPDASLAGTGVAALGPAAQARTGLPYNTASPPIPQAASIASAACCPLTQPGGNLAPGRPASTGGGDPRDRQNTTEPAGDASSLNLA